MHCFGSASHHKMKKKRQDNHVNYGLQTLKLTSEDSPGTSLNGNQVHGKLYNPLDDSTSHSNCAISTSPHKRMGSQEFGDLEWILSHCWLCAISSTGKREIDKSLHYFNFLIFSCLLLLGIFLKDFIYLFLETGQVKERERERNINLWLPLLYPWLGSWPATQACALTGNRTCNPLVHRLALNPLSHTNQGTPWLIWDKTPGLFSYRKNGFIIGNFQFAWNLKTVQWWILSFSICYFVSLFYVIYIFDF